MLFLLVLATHLCVYVCMFVFVLSLVIAASLPLCYLSILDMCVCVLVYAHACVCFNIPHYRGSAILLNSPTHLCEYV